MLQGPSLPASDLRQYYQPGSVWDSAEATCSLQAFCCLTEDKEARTAHAQQALAAARELSAKQDAEQHCQLKVLEEGARFAFTFNSVPRRKPWRGSTQKRPVFSNWRPLFTCIPMRALKAEATAFKKLQEEQRLKTEAEAAERLKAEARVQWFEALLARRN